MYLLRAFPSFRVEFIYAVPRFGGGLLPVLPGEDAVASRIIADADAPPVSEQGVSRLHDPHPLGSTVPCVGHVIDLDVIEGIAIDF